jgi:1-aminocyclopropane-1-carboxylate deaminase
MYLSHQEPFNLPSPIHSVDNDMFGFHLDVKREDLIHPLIKGNKYRKLKYNLKEFSDKNYDGIITFGGAYSNHLHATAALGHAYNIPTIGIVRGEEFGENEVLAFCKSAGMVIRQVSREAYKEKQNHPDIAKIIEDYPNYLLIPEGGSNDLAIKGVAELVDEISNQYDFIAVAAGTGCTAAGIIKRIDELNLPTKVLVFSALKGDWMRDEITTQLGYLPNKHYISDKYCQGGYAKVNDEYEALLNKIRISTKLPIDHVYNGKILVGLIDLAMKGVVNKEHRVLWVNSGGVV